MNTFQGKTLSWRVVDGTIELTLIMLRATNWHTVLAELEQFVGAMGKLKRRSARADYFERTHGRFLRGGDFARAVYLSQELPVPSAERPSRLYRANSCSDERA